MEKTLLLSYTLPPNPTGSATVISNLLTQFNENEILVIGARGFKAEKQPDILGQPKVRHILWRAPSIRGAGLLNLTQLPIAFLLAFYHLIKNNCKNVIAVFPNNEFLLLGWILAKLTGTRFHPYFHNSFSTNKARTGWKRILFEKLEHILISNAETIFIISDGLKELYQIKYPSFSQKFITIRHSFPEYDTKRKYEVHAKSSLKDLVMLGSINSSNLDATLRLMKAVKRLPDTDIELFSGTPLEVLKKYDILKYCNLGRRLTRGDMLKRIQKADAVLLPHGFEGNLSNEEFQTIFPTKTIEYLASEVPIIAHCPSNSYIAKFLTENKCAFVISDTEVDKVEERLMFFSKNQTQNLSYVENALDLLNTFRSDTIAQILRENLKGSKNKV